MSLHVLPGPQSYKPFRSCQQLGQTIPPNILHMTFSLHPLPARFPEAYGSHELSPCSSWGPKQATKVPTLSRTHGDAIRSVLGL